MEVDILEFLVPVENNKTLFVWDIQPSHTEAQIYVSPPWGQVCVSSSGCQVYVSPPGGQVCVSSSGGQVYVSPPGGQVCVSPPPGGQVCVSPPGGLGIKPQYFSTD